MTVMITREQALKLTPGDQLHAGTCTEYNGPRGGRRTYIEVWRVNGQTKLWKKSPERFKIPIKTGFNGPYFYLTEDNLADFHLPADCQPEVR